MAGPSTPRRNWLSYRLRTLLILITVVAVLLAWIGNARRQSKLELQIADELQRSDFTDVVVAGPYDSWEEVGFDGPQGWWRDLARRVLGERVLIVRIGKQDFDDASPLANLTRLRRLDLRTTQITDLRPLAGLQKLEWLDLGFTPVDDVSPLAELHNLTSLSLDSTQVSDVKPLAKMRKLKTLNLRATKIRDLSPLRSRTTLTTLGVNLAPVSREQIEALQQALPKCQVLHSLYPAP